MRSISKDEIAAATFKIDAEVKLSGSNEDKLLLAAKRVSKGESVDDVAVDVFNSSSDFMKQKILDRLELIKNGKQMDYIRSHRMKPADTTEHRFRRFNSS